MARSLILFHPTFLKGKNSLNRVNRKKLKVSVIVPNFNHAAFLKQRLDTIYNQNYPYFEVILLDDCSQDNSVSILQSYASLYKEKTKLIVNNVNSGGVFRQWKKGLAEATGDLIWIAESDDYCDLNFLTSLVSYFEDESILLSYARTVFTDSSGKETWNTESYLNSLSSSRWLKPHVNTAIKEVEDYFSRMNIIPNASSALFRKPKSMSLLDEESWISMSVCGDWVFYLHRILGGRIAYTNKTNNYYRIHQKNTSVSVYTKDVYYKEHQLVAEQIAKLYKISLPQLEKIYEKAKFDWISNRSDFSVQKLNEVYEKSKVEEQIKNLRPSIAMCAYGFASGGGETFPIRLANFLHRKGYSTTFVNFNFTERNEKIREMLDPDISVINISNISASREILLNYQFDIIHSHHAEIDLLINQMKLSARHVISMHGMYERMAQNKFLSASTKLKKSVSAWIYTTDKNLFPFEKRKDFKDFFFTKIGNGVEITVPSAIPRRDLNIDNDAFVVCIVSRAIPEKGWIEAIKIISLVRKSTQKDVQLLLIGDGPLYDELKDHTPSFVHCLGFRENILDYFATSDLGFLPSTFSGESFPLVVMDSLVAGKPVLASDIGEIKKMLTLDDLNQVAGSVFALQDMRIPIVEVASILAKYVTDKDFLNSKVALVPRALKKFDLNEVIGKYEALYSNIASRVSL